MKKLEQAFNTTFNHWLKEVYKKTGAYELKHTHGKDSLPFSAVKDHQIAALIAAKHGTFVYKISDIGMVQVPFDCFSLAGVPAYVVIQYPEFFCLIDIDEFNIEASASERKSLTSDRARQIASIVVE